MGLRLPSPLQSFKEKGEELLSTIGESRKVTVMPLFYSMNRFIAKPDVDTICERLSSIGERTKMDAILFSAGGDPDQAYLIATMLQEYAKEKLTIIVPRYAKSAATLLACSADEVVVGPASELGPIDPVIEVPETRRYVPVQSLIELIEMIGKGSMAKEVVEEILKRIPVIELGDYRRLTEHIEDLAGKLLSRRMFKGQQDKAVEIAKKLCAFKSHRAAIARADLKEIGLKLSELPDEVWNAIWKLHKLWREYVIEYENKLPEESIEPLCFSLGSGLVFTVQASSQRKTELEAYCEVGDVNVEFFVHFEPPMHGHSSHVHVGLLCPKLENGTCSITKKPCHLMPAG